MAAIGVLEKKKAKQTFSQQQTKTLQSGRAGCLLSTLIRLRDRCQLMGEFVLKLWDQSYHMARFMGVFLLSRG